MGNANVPIGVFSNPLVDGKHLFGEFTPVLGGIGVAETDDMEEYIQEELDTDTMLQMLHDLECETHKSTT